jgi:acetylornithine deacetylase/succinyl-diaminopimelate desuccinylase-like protein
MTNPIREWVHERREEILGLLSKFVAIDSVTGNEGPLAEFCAGWLRDHDIETVLHPCKGRHNVLSVVGEGNPTLVLSGHLDTVPPNEGEWTYGPHEPVVADGKLYGLGSSDLHASMVGAYYASLFLKGRELPGRLVTAFTIEEETTGDGTRLMLDWAEETGFFDFSQTTCLVTEPTGLDHLCLGNRASSFLVLTVKGLGGHGSRPHLAKNPLWKLMEILDGLRGLEARWKESCSDADFGFTTLTPTSIIAGDMDRTNVIPEIARAVVDCRPTPLLWANDLERFRSELGACLATFKEEGFDITWKELYAREGHKVDAGHPLAANVLSVLQDDLGFPQAEFRYTPAGNDAVYFALKGIPTVNKVGPGHPECAHRVDEFVKVENVLLGVELYVHITLKHFGLQV